MFVGRQIYLDTRHNFIVALKVNYTMIGKQVDAAIDVFLVCLPVKNYDMLHHFIAALVRYIMKHFSMNNYVLLYLPQYPCGHF